MLNNSKAVYEDDLVSLNVGLEDEFWAFNIRSGMIPQSTADYLLNYRNLSSHIDMHTHADSTLDNCATLTFDLLTPGSMYVEVLP